MPHLIGPDFIGIQAKDLEAARSFYTEVVGSGGEGCRGSFGQLA